MTDPQLIRTLFAELPEEQQEAIWHALRPCLELPRFGDTMLMELAYKLGRFLNAHEVRATREEVSDECN